MCLEQLTHHLEGKLYACLTKNCAFYSEEQDMQSLHLPKCDDKWDLSQQNHIEENKCGNKNTLRIFFPSSENRENHINHYLLKYILFSLSVNNK